MISYQELSKEELMEKLDELKHELQNMELSEGIKQITYNLSVHQIELEIRNRELQETQQLLEESRARYIELYDYSPIGYLTFDVNGNILEAKLTAARM